MIALACFLSFIHFLISSLIQIFSLAWKTAIVILASLITVMKKRKNPAKFSLYRCGSKCLFKSTKHMLFQGRTEPQRVKSVGLPKAIHWDVVLALEAESIGGLDCGEWRCPSLGNMGLSWESCLAAAASWTSCISAFSFFLVTSLLLETATAVKQSWMEVGIHRGISSWPTKPSALLAFPALLCRVLSHGPIAWPYAQKGAGGIFCGQHKS